MWSNIQQITIPSLQGTLVKTTKPTLQSIFSKEPFRLSLGQRNTTNLIIKLIEIKNRQCLTTKISKLGVSGL